MDLAPNIISEVYDTISQFANSLWSFFESCALIFPYEIIISLSASITVVLVLRIWHGASGG